MIDETTADRRLPAEIFVSRRPGSMYEYTAIGVPRSLTDAYRIGLGTTAAEALADLEKTATARWSAVAKTWLKHDK